MGGKIIIFAVVLIIFVSGCVQEKTPTAGDGGATPPPTQNITSIADDAKASSDDVSSAVNASNQFALELYSELEDGDGNIFFSPWSISTALAMAYEGSRGQTKEEIRSVFHFQDDDSIRRSSFAAIHSRLNVDADYKLRTANALWVQENYRLLDEYTGTVEEYYGGEAVNVDFAQDTEGARKTINDWVEEKTDNKIRDLFPQGSLNPMTRLVLTNAIYFKGNWVKKFDESETRDEEFRIRKDSVAQVPMMRRTDREAEFNYTETDELQVLEMFYEGEELSMLVLLPKENDLTSLEKSLTLEKLNQWREQLKEQRVNVFMPKFTFDSRYSLNKNLKELGMPSAFTENVADFSGIDGTKNLFIQGVIHQAFVDVNEEGTEAAAATGVAIGVESIGPRIPIFRADHPFIFIIQERKTGNILFLGRVVDPSK